MSGTQEELQELLAIAQEARGFLPRDEAEVLVAEAREQVSAGPLLEIGTWCGKSALHLGAVVREARRKGASDAVLFTVDHHRGSEENQPGWQYHEPDLVDPEAGRIDTLPFFRRALVRAGLEDEVVAIVGRAPLVARYWRTPLSLVFVDGGHTDEHVRNDYEGFGRWVQPGGSLVFHDIFEDPHEGGQAPWRCYRRALDSRVWQEKKALGSLRILTRVRGQAGARV